MTKQQKKGWMIGLTALLVVGLVAGAWALINSSKENKSDQKDEALVDKIQDAPQEKPEQTHPDAGISVDLADYTVYQIDGLDFQFVIAKIRVKTDSTINVDLSHFITSEQIKLNEVSSYRSQLEQNGYFLGKQNVLFDLVSNQNTLVANIFVPVKDKNAKTVTVTTDLQGNEEMVFDLSNKTGKIENLQYEADDVITDGETYQMKVSSAFPTNDEGMTRKYTDGTTESFNVDSMSQIYAFNVEAVSLWGDTLVIEDAIYITDEGAEFGCFSELYTHAKYDNMIGKEIKDASKGTILLVTYNNFENPITYHGELKLKVQGQDNWISIRVDL